MHLFGKKEKPAEPYDANRLTPAIRSSICTGEKSAGFQDKTTGKFVEVTLIRTPADLDAFRKRYGIAGEIKTIY